MNDSNLFSELASCVASGEQEKNRAYFVLNFGPPFKYQSLMAMYTQKRRMHLMLAWCARSMNVLWLRSTYVSRLSGRPQRRKVYTCVYLEYYIQSTKLSQFRHGTIVCPPEQTEKEKKKVMSFAGNKNKFSFALRVPVEWQPAFLHLPQK